MFLGLHPHPSHFLKAISPSHSLLQLPRGVCALVQLKCASLGSNNFASFPRELLDLPLVELNMGGCRGAHSGKRRKEPLVIPDGIRAMTTLEILHYTFNELRSLPEAMASLTRLRALDVSRQQDHNCVSSASVRTLLPAYALPS